MEINGWVGFAGVRDFGETRWKSALARITGGGAFSSGNSQSAFTLAEVVISLAVAAVAISGVITGYINCVSRAEWLACSSAAQMQASQRIEQIRIARWDTLANPAVDEVTTNQFPMTVQALDLPKASEKVINATNRVTITTISADPPVRMVKVECTWRFPARKVIYTNTLTTYRCPDQ